jgi:photosystem II stability/assembly factor-like uncharacterized protein
MNKKYHLKTLYPPFILLPAVLLVSFIVLCPASNADAPDDAARWARVGIPSEGEAGKWVLAQGSDVKCLATAGDGTLYSYVEGLAHTLYRSEDGGASWLHVGDVSDEIIDIVISPDDPGTAYYATAYDVYRSTDNGTSFHPLPTGPGAITDNIEITSIDVTWYGSNIIAAGTRDTDASGFGEIYILDEANIFSGWTPTNIGDYDVYAVAFSPNYSTDFQLIAVVTDEIDTFTASRRGSMEWNALTPLTKFSRDNTGVSVLTAAPAAIAFPDNYDASADPPENTYYVGIDTGTGDGDVYKIACDYPRHAVVTDLNAGSIYGAGNLDITSLEAAGTCPNVSLVAGASDSPGIYLSFDGGLSWETCRKGPTGETGTRVLLAPDFTTSGLAYAASSGTGSACSISRDGGQTWNQISLIDDIIITIVDIAPSPRYDDDATIFMITFGTGHSLWRTRKGGGWERVLATGLASADALNMVGLPPQYGDGCRTVFVAGQSNGQPAVWKSTDDGQDYRRRYSKDPRTGTALFIDAWAISDENTLFVGGFDGSNGVVYKTINSGFFYSMAVPAGNQSLHSLVLSPDYQQDGNILVGNTNGWVYWSDNDGASFQSLPAGASTPPLTGSITVAFDPCFATNKTVYAASDAADGGIYRFIIGESYSWENIDDTLPTGAILSQVIASPSGALYASNFKNGGGIERCLNPTAASGTVFETVKSGLDNNASLSGVWQSGHRLWSVDTVNTILLTFNDTLTSAVRLVSPENEALGAGNIMDNTVKNVIIDWETLEGAAGYEWRCDNDNDFSSIPDGFEAVTPASSARLPALEPATTYYWQVRVSTPVTSPWSEKRSFTTTMAPYAPSVILEIPSPGASDVPVKPVFQWTALEGAVTYELVVARDADFTGPIIFKKDEYALSSNAWQSDVLLDNDTTYYWKVRALSPNTNSGWSGAGAFTTGPTPVTEIEGALEETAPSPSSQYQDIVPADVLSQYQSMPLDSQEKPPTPPSEPPVAPSVQHAVNSRVVQDWAIYLIGSLIAAVIFALIIILVMVLKMGRL